MRKESLTLNKTIKRALPYALGLVVFGTFSGVLFQLAQAATEEAAKTARAKSDELTLRQALKQYRADCSTYPTSAQGLSVLEQAPAGLESRWKGPYVKPRIPGGPWGHSYVYTSSGKNFYIATYDGAGKPIGLAGTTTLGLVKDP